MVSAHIALAVGLLLAPAAASQTHQLVSAKPDGFAPSMQSRFGFPSNDGRYVAFSSLSGELVPGDVNNHFDIYLRDLQAGSTVLVSHTPAGGWFAVDSQLDAMTPDGSTVLFTNANVVYLWDRVTGQVSPASLDGNGATVSGQSSEISDDGRFIAWFTTAAVTPGDVNGKSDVFLRDRQTGAVELISVSSSGV